jgi:hypothetical protein
MNSSGMERKDNRTILVQSVKGKENIQSWKKPRLTHHLHPIGIPLLPISYPLARGKWQKNQKSNTTDNILESGGGGTIGQF